MWAGVPTIPSFMVIVIIKLTSHKFSSIPWLENSIIKNKDKVYVQESVYMYIRIFVQHVCLPWSQAYFLFHVARHRWSGSWYDHDIPIGIQYIAYIMNRPRPLHVIHVHVCRGRVAINQIYKATSRNFNFSGTI